MLRVWKDNECFLGTFTVTDNAYSARCGIEVGASGHMFTMLQLSVADAKKTRGANTSFSGDHVKFCRLNDASCQIDPSPEYTNKTLSASAMCGECGIPESVRRRDPPGPDLSSPGVLLKTVYREGIDVSLPPLSKDLDKELRKLARRVITNTNSGRIVADETVHHRSHVSYPRDTLPKDITNMRVDYYRGADGIYLDEDSSCSGESESESCEYIDIADGYFHSRQLPAGFQEIRRAEKEEIKRKQRRNARLRTREALSGGHRGSGGLCPPGRIVRQKSRTLLSRPG